MLAAVARPTPRGAEETPSSLLSAEQHVDIVDGWKKGWFWCKRQGVDVQSTREVLRRGTSPRIHNTRCAQSTGPRG